ncbi:hypothetical protein WN943_027528 [Citrus x changshan-huyou]
MHLFYMVSSTESVTSTIYIISVIVTQIKFVRHPSYLYVPAYHAQAAGLGYGTNHIESGFEVLFLLVFDTCELHLMLVLGVCIWVCACMYLFLSSFTPGCHSCGFTFVGNHNPSKVDLYCGNIDSTEAGSMIQYIKDVFFKGSNPICQPLFPPQHLTNRLISLDKGKNYVYSNRGLNPSDENSCLVHRDDFLMNVKLKRFALTAKQPA